MSVLRRLFAGIVFVFFFFWEFIKANLSVAYITLCVKKSAIKPHLVDYDVGDLTHREVLILAQLITLTPGSIVTMIDEEKRVLSIHILSAVDPQKVLEGIDRKLKRALLEVTR